jgi:DNA-binding transcriptional MerR regulator
MSTYRISEASERTGFPASTLRYYEDVGLIVPARTEAGYRVYDDRAIERLRFVSRAKQLGLQLDEITDLVALWDDDRCAPVAHRLRDLVTDKLQTTQDRVAELVAFAAQLQRVIAGLDGPVGDGPCGPSCACHADGDTEPSAADERVAVPLVAKPPSPPEVPPIACTLAPDRMSDRMVEWQELLARAVGREPVDGGVRVRFPAGAEPAVEVARLAAAEQACCPFFEFTIAVHHTGTVLEVRAPADAAVLVDAVLGVAP